MSSAKAEAEAGVTTDALLGGRLILRQPRTGHRFGTDAVLLAAAAAAEPATMAVDLGAGVGAAGLAVALARPELTMALVEIDPALAALAASNVAQNGLAARVRVVTGDVAELGRPSFPALAPATADLVLANPPFHAAGRHRASPDGRRALAHSAPERLVQDWVAAGARLLGARGRLVTIHRADALGAVLTALGRRFGSVRLRPVHPRQDAPASRIVVSAVLGGRAPLSIAPPLVLHEAAGGFTAEAEALHRGVWTSAPAKTNGAPEGAP